MIPLSALGARPPGGGGQPWLFDGASGPGGGGGGVGGGGGFGGRSNGVGAQNAGQGSLGGGMIPLGSLGSGLTQPGGGSALGGGVQSFLGSGASPFSVPPLVSGLGAGGLLPPPGAGSAPGGGAVEGGSSGRAVVTGGGGGGAGPANDLPGVMAGGGVTDTNSKPYQPEDAPETETALAEVGKTAKEYLDVLMPITIPKSEEDSRPVPKPLRCLDDGTDIFKMFDCDPNRFDSRAVRKGFHKLALFVHPEKLGREASPADQARYIKLKQAYTVVMDEQLRAVYRQHCFGIAGSGGCPAQGHEVALSKALVLGRELRKMGEDRSIVLHKAAETGWSNQQKDQDGRTMRGDGRKLAHQFNLFGDISSSEGDDAGMEKERRNMTILQILEKSPKYADLFLEKARPLLQDPKVSTPAAGGAFTTLEKPALGELLSESPKSVQKHLRKLRTAVKQMNWAMTSLLQHKESPWRGLEVKSSLVEHAVTKLLELIKSGIAFGKFTELHEEELGKLLDNVNKLYMDLFERRGQELLRSSIQAETMVVHLLPESEGRLPDGTRVTLQELGSRQDLNGRCGLVSGWDYSLQRYTVELEKQEQKRPGGGELGPSNPDLIALEDFDADEEEEDDEDQAQLQLAIPKKLMVLPKNVLVDLEPSRRRLETLVKDWNAWRRRPRSVSASQDAEAVAANLGPPLESMAQYLQESAAAVATASACGRDGADLIAFECREALQGARNLAAKLLGEEPKEPPPPPPLQEPPPAIVPIGPYDPEAEALREAAEVAQAGLSEIVALQQAKKNRSRSRGKKKRSRSRSRRRRRRQESSESDSFRPHRKPKYA